MYYLAYTKRALKDKRKLEGSPLYSKAAGYVQIIEQNPFQNPPPYEKLSGEESTYSRRLNQQHRFVYQVLPNADNAVDKTGIPYQGIIKVLSMWTHYE